MKKYIVYFTTILAALLLATACEQDNPDTSYSVIADRIQEQNDFDRWLEANYVNPYNIDFKYRFELNESDVNYFTIPADMDNSIIMAHLVKYLCVDTYDEVAGIRFTRTYFPKMFFLIGEWEYRNNGTYILGTAEGGKKILLSGINYLDQYMVSADALNYYYIKTIHHEFTHILNQTLAYPADFKEISGSDYIADEWNLTSGWLQKGFITQYSQHSDREDFAEMLSTYITNTEEQWDAWMTQAGDGAEIIQAKLDLVRSYMLSGFDIDIDVLRNTILRRQDEVMDGRVDLTSVSVE
ncbi:MAG: putative zinc-binding metallopeptidase [Bacteroidales bacterium]|nr:putative zinc-binding metallopeptidase [Bacteroidales bacterium]